MKLRKKLEKVLTEDELIAVKDAMENTQYELEDDGEMEDAYFLQTAWNKMFVD